MATSAGVYMEMAEAIEHYEHWIDFWLGARSDPPPKPNWMTPNDACRVKVLTQSIVHTSKGT